MAMKSKEETPVEPGVDQRELAALMGIITALEPLSKEARGRIIRYARDKFNIYMSDST